MAAKPTSPKTTAKPSAKDKLRALKSMVFGSKKAAPAAAAKAAPKAPATKAAPPASKKAAAPQPAAPAKAAKTPRSRSAKSETVYVSPENMCHEVACESLATTGGYCRLHYIKNWKKIQRKIIILKEGKLNQYIEELVAKYPDKYIEAIRQDLDDDKAFAKVIHDLDLDEGSDEFEGEGESLEAVIGDIKREFEDEGESF